MDHNKTEADAVRDIMQMYAGSETILLTDNTEPRHESSATAYLVPEGKKLVSLKALRDEYRIRPDRRTGKAVFTSLESFIAHANRFKGENSVVFACDDMKKPSVLVVLDYHEAGSDERSGTHFGSHKGQFDFPLSETWKAWTKAEEDSMTMPEFAEFLEDRIGDVIEPLGPYVEGEAATDTDLRQRIERLGGSLASPAQLLSLSRDFRVNENNKVKSALVLSSGEVQIAFTSEHTDETGAPIKVPNMLLIQSPIFENGVAYRIPVRLRYRTSNGKVVWIVKRLNPEIFIRHAFAEALDQTVAETGLPLFRGAPEV